MARDAHIGIRRGLIPPVLAAKLEARRSEFRRAIFFQARGRGKAPVARHRRLADECVENDT